MNPAEEYILRQKEPFQSILLCIRDIVLASNDDIQEQFKYGLPFYRFNEKPLCYFNVPKNKNRVDICFWKGFELEDKHQILHARDRKMIKCVEIYSLEEINIKGIVSLLKESFKL
jgi:hypothetical protein